MVYMAFYLTTIYLNKRMITNYYLKKSEVFEYQIIKKSEVFWVHFIKKSEVFWVSP